MDAKDLMIGDLVIHGFGGIGKITEIDSKTVVIKDDGFDTGDGMNEVSFAINELTPIPITPEILEKNGFDMSDKEVMQYHFEEDGEKYHFSLRQMYDKDGKPHGYSFYSFNVLTLLDYVHQLQHALKLCEINKEIEI